MFGFVLADSLPRLLNGDSAADADPVVVELYGRPVRSSEVGMMAAERSRASRFIAELVQLIGGRPIDPAQIFGDVKTRPIVDALILQHQADALEMPPPTPRSPGSGSSRGPAGSSTQTSSRRP